MSNPTLGNNISNPVWEILNQLQGLLMTMSKICKNQDFVNDLGNTYEKLSSVAAQMDKSPQVIPEETRAPGLKS